MTIRITPAEFAATVEKIEKINARAEKRGFTGRLAVEGERVEVTSTDALGFERTEVFYETAITGDAPVYNGWRFLARVDALGDSFTIATAPGVDHVSRDLVRPGHCDHCESARYRKNTYLVQDVESGEVKNVGSTCIKDFLGWSASVVFYSEQQVSEEVFGAGSGFGERAFSVDTVVAYAYAAIKAFGWMPATNYGETTRQWVTLALGIYRPNKQEEAMLPLLRQYAAEATERVAAVRAYITSDEFSGQSTYVDNLKASFTADYVTHRQLGLVVSAPQAYIRHLETAADRQAREARWAAEKAAKTVSDYIAEVGAKKVQFTGTVSAIRYIEGQYGTTTLYTFLTAEGNLVKWFSSAGLHTPKVAEEDCYVSGQGHVDKGQEFQAEVQEGDVVTLVGTVKSHDDYQGTKSTVMTRCKVVQS